MKTAFSIVFFLLLSVFAFAQDPLHVFPSGNVGIGVNDATAKLEVNGRIKDQWGFVMPVGTILPFALSSAPAGWLICDGSVIDKQVNPELTFLVDALRLAANGNTNHPYIAGLTASKARLPDLRGDFLRGSNVMINNASVMGVTPPAGPRANADPDSAGRTNPQTGTVIGAVVGAAQNDSIQTHSHDESVYAITSACNGAPYCEDNMTAGMNCLTSGMGNATGTVASPYFTLSSPTGARVSANETRADNTLVYYIIKY